MKIAAVVVTFNRKNLLIECLDSLINQTYPLDAIYIIDNASTDGTPEFLIEKGFINKVLSPVNEPIEDKKTIKLPAFDKTTEIHYVRMHENTGGAGGFHEGIKRGYEAGYDWLWLMDDDTLPAYDALDNLIDNDIIFKKDTMALCCKVTDRNGRINLGHRRTVDCYFREHMNSEQDYEKAIFEINLFSFVGVLLRTNTVRKIGLPFREYFIFFDDTEYSLRLSRLGRIYVIPKSVVFHELPRRTKEDWKVTWRLFFIIRNPIHMYWHHIMHDNINLIRKSGVFLRIVIWQSVLKPLLRPLVRACYKGQRVQYLRIALEAVYQGITRKFNNDLEKVNRLLK